MIVAAVQIQNLLYLVGALVAATVVSGLIVLRHRKPKSLEAGIESFSRELKALAPERRPPAGRETRAGAEREPAEGRRNLRARPIVRSSASRGARHSSVTVGGVPSVTDPDDDETSDTGEAHGAAEAADVGDVGDAGDVEGQKPSDAGHMRQDSSAPADSRDTDEGAHFHTLEGRQTDTGQHPGRSNGG